MVLQWREELRLVARQSLVVSLEQEVKRREVKMGELQVQSLIRAVRLLREEKVKSVKVVASSYRQADCLEAAAILRMIE